MKVVQKRSPVSVSPLSRSAGLQRADVRQPSVGPAAHVRPLLAGRGPGRAAASVQLLCQGHWTSGERFFFTPLSFIFTRMTTHRKGP